MREAHSVGRPARVFSRAQLITLLCVLILRSAHNLRNPPSCKVHSPAQNLPSYGASNFNTAAKLRDTSAFFSREFGETALQHCWVFWPTLSERIKSNLFSDECDFVLIKGKPANHQLIILRIAPSSGAAYCMRLLCKNASAASCTKGAYSRPRLERIVRRYLGDLHLIYTLCRILPAATKT
jgi:hypothetical protein